MGRGGTATANIKRYDIGRVYHKSLVGGHPRESLEASFDIAHENQSIDSVHIEAECILVLCKALTIVAPNRNEKIANPALDNSPIWYLRLSHTRLTESILEVCGVPPKEALRRRCCQILTQLTAPTTKAALNACRRLKTRDRSRSEGSLGETERSRSDELERQVAALVEEGLPRPAAQRLRLFLSSGCCPLPTNLSDASDALLRAVVNLRQLETNINTDPRRWKRYDDIGRSVKHLKNLNKVLLAIGVSPYLNGSHHFHNDTAELNQHPHISRPLYICLDLGLRQRRQIYSLLHFQALMIPPSLLHSSSKLTEGHSDVGIMVAEGGRYDDLVRKYRPPGNFGSALLSFYTNASIPICAGVRFSVGKLVESLYMESAPLLSRPSADMESNVKFASDAAGVEYLRSSLGHPLNVAKSVQVMVASTNGMDAASASERLIVASHLWASGISAEYLTHSGVMISLLRARSREDATSSDWSLEELCAVCGIMNIPYVVVVQPHLLRDKGSVRLRRIQFDSNTSGSSSSSEKFVSLQSLAAAILDGHVDDGDHPFEPNDDIDTFDGNTGYGQNRQSWKGSRVECVCVETDQFWGSDKQMPKSDTQNWKSILKSLKTVSQRSEAYLESISGSSSSHGAVVFAADLPFWVLREFGTTLMRRGDSTATTAGAETIERYPKHKRILKTLSMAIDASMKSRGYWNNNIQKGASSSSRDLLTILLYSRLDDRFDMISLGDGGGFDADRDGNELAGRNRRSDRKKS